MSPAQCRAPGLQPCLRLPVQQVPSGGPEDHLGDAHTACPWPRGASCLCIPLPLPPGLPPARGLLMAPAEQAQMQKGQLPLSALRRSDLICHAQRIGCALHNYTDSSHTDANGTLRSCTTRWPQLSMEQKCWVSIQCGWDLGPGSTMGYTGDRDKDDNHSGSQ